MGFRVRLISLIGLILALTWLVQPRYVAQAQAPAAGNLLAVLTADGRFNEFLTAVDGAQLRSMLESTGPYTLFAPTDLAFLALAAEDRTALSTPNAQRQLVLYHTLQGVNNAEALRGATTLTSALGRPINVVAFTGAIALNDRARVITPDVAASNGVIHIIDQVLLPNAGAAPPTGDQGGGSGSGTAPARSFAPPAPVSLNVWNPFENPAYVGGGRIPYHIGINTESETCKGMTWVVLSQLDGVTFVGADRQTNPYRGDTPCGTTLPMLCLNRDYSQPPRARDNFNFYDGWAGGTVRATAPVVGTQMRSLEQANQICQYSFGPGWRMAEFHDGGLGVEPGQTSGWDFWAYGGLAIGTRYWVHINDQPANPWDSQQRIIGPVTSSTAQPVPWPGADPAYRGDNKIMPSAGRGQGRSVCRGMTWVVHVQVEGLVKVGYDSLTNPYAGDRSCDEAWPVLCIRVEGLAPPPNTSRHSYNEAWSGGSVRMTGPVTGHRIDTRARANALCRDSFGSGWRMAQFHDGSLGTGGTDGWSFWAYGSLTTGQRFWVSINDQPANPWNPVAQ